MGGNKKLGLGLGFGGFYLEGRKRASFVISVWCLEVRRSTFLFEARFKEAASLGRRFPNEPN